MKKALVYIRGFAFLASILGLAAISAPDSESSRDGIKIMASEKSCSISDAAVSSIRQEEEVDFFVVGCGGFL